jgi:hypothetical protein
VKKLSKILETGLFLVEEGVFISSYLPVTSHLHERQPKATGILVQAILKSESQRWVSDLY